MFLRDSGYLFPSERECGREARRGRERGKRARARTNIPNIWERVNRNSSRTLAPTKIAKSKFMKSHRQHIVSVFFASQVPKQLQLNLVNPAFSAFLSCTAVAMRNQWGRLLVTPSRPSRCSCDAKKLWQYTLQQLKRYFNPITCKTVALQFCLWHLFFS